MNLVLSGSLNLEGEEEEEAERQRSDSLPHPGDDRLATSLAEPQGGQVREKAEHQTEEGPDNATGAATVGGNDISCL